MKNVLMVFGMVFFLLFVLLYALPAASKTSWHFPLEIKAGLSSNFGEFRGNRVHTGVDLRTNGITGYKVYAIDDGTIVRLSVLKLGFGNALYIEHPNGLMSVYGHLDRFEEKTLGLQTLVRQYQQQRGTKYPGNIFLKKPVKRGQIIGYSGETGYGLPHLHFEVRRGGDTPIDPFEHGFEYQDTTPPIMESIIIEPLGSQSLLDGEHFSKEYRLQKQQGKYIAGHIPKIYGKVRFTIATYDQIGAQNKCGVDKLVLSIDDKTFFQNQFDAVTYNTNHRGGLVYDFNLTRLNGPSQFYYRLYNLSPAHFPYRQVFSENNGIWDPTGVSEGLHTVVVEVGDVVGNHSIAQLRVSVEHEARYAKQKPQNGSSKQSKPELALELFDFSEFLEIICESNVALSEPPVLLASIGNDGLARIQLQPRGQNVFSGVYDLMPGKDGMLNLTVSATTPNGQQIQATHQFPVNTIFARRGGTVRYGDRASMFFPPGALYEDIFANIFPTSAYEETNGLPVIGEVYDFRPVGCPLEKKGVIRIQYPTDVNDPKKLGIFWWDNIKQRWYFMDDQLDQKIRSLSAEIIYPSIYAILQDNVDPKISNLIPAPGSTVSASHKELSAIISDVGKGVNEDSIVMELDGKKVDGEYDPDRDKFTYVLTKKLSIGTHTLTVKAYDKAGNPAKTKSSTFTVQ